MIKPASLLIGCILTVSGFGLSRQTAPDLANDQWLLERYFEATSVEEGMTRADLIRVFRVDGGLQPLGLPTRYVLKSSNMIKVDVEFDVPRNTKAKIVPEDLRDEVESSGYDSEGKPLWKEGYQFIANEKLKIKRISKPYIEQFNYD